MSRARSAATMAEWCRGCSRTICYGARKHCDTCIRARTDRRALAFVVALVAALCLLLARAHAQDTVTTTLARAAVAESDWNARDQAATLHVYAYRAARAGVSVEQMALSYSSIFRAKPTPRTRWVLQLEPACTQPEAWPSNLAWSRYEAKCRATFVRVDRFLRGELPDPCAGRAQHFGSAVLAVDLARAERAGWRRVACGRVLNAFYARGRR